MDSTTSTTTARKLGWYHGWNIVAVCFLAGIASSALPINAFSLFLQHWSSDLHVSISTVTICMTGLGVMTAATAPLCGMAVDRLPTRVVLGFGVAGLAVFYIATSFVTRMWELLALYALVFPPALNCATTIPANAVVMRWFVRRLGLAMGITAMGVSIAGIVMPPIAAALLPHLGWRLVWRFFGILVAVLVVPAILMIVRDRPTERDGLHYMTHDGDAPMKHGHASEPSNLRWGDILARRNFWVLAVAYLTLLILNGGAGYNISVIAASHGLGVEAGGLLISGWSLALMGTTLAVGAISDKIGNRLPLVGLGVLCSIGGVVVAFSGNFPGLLVGALLTGAGGGFWPLLGSALAAEYGAAGFGRAMGTMLMTLPLASTPTYFVAKLKETTGSYVPPLLALVVVCALGSVVTFLFLREKRGGNVTLDEQAKIEEATVPTV